MTTVEVYRRTDHRWAWRAVAANGQIIATDGSQGYEHKADAIQTARTVTGFEPVDVGDQD